MKRSARRLLRETNRTYLRFSAAFLLLAGSLLYCALTAVLEEETNEKLLANKERITRQIHRGQAVTQLPPVIEVEKLDFPLAEGLRISDTVLYDPIEEETEIFRQVTVVESINGKKYRVILRQVVLEPHDYYYSIGLALALVVALLPVGLLLVNRGISRRLWQPFYQNLETLKTFSVQQGEAIYLHPSPITEFRELNQAIQQLTDRVRTDYHSLKEFTENASHEMQTPLAILQAKLELLLQSAGLTEEQANGVHAAQSAARRLAKLIQTLLLLTKIGNHQFTTLERVCLDERTEQQLEQFGDFIREKDLRVDKQLSANATVTANPVLIDILLSNLLGNAIKHNLPGGSIRIELRGNSLTVANTGPPLSVSPQKLFERFYKANPSSESLGLGLAIVREIGESSGWQITYTTQGEWHVLKVNFRTSKFP